MGNQRLDMRIARALSVMFSVFNFVLAYVLLEACKWAKDSVDIVLPSFFYLGESFAYGMALMALIAFSVVPFVWFAEPILAVFSRKPCVNNIRFKITCTDGALLIMSFASYLAIVVTICNVVMANFDFRLVLNYGR